MTDGKLGKAQFSTSFWPEQLVPRFAAGGAEADIHVSLKNEGCSRPTFASVRTSNPAIATFTVTDETVHVKTLAAGTTSLDLLDDNGQLIDTTDIQVEDIASYQSVYQPQVADRAHLAEGAPAELRFRALDASGRVLFDWGATRVTLSGALTVPPEARQVVDLDWILMRGTIGQGSVEIADGNAHARFDVEVVSLDDVARIGIRVGDVPTVAELVSVTAVPELADGSPVYGAQCAWSMSDPSVTVEGADPQGTRVALDGYARSEATLHFSKHGTFTATCRVGRAVASTAVTY